MANEKTYRIRIASETKTTKHAAITAIEAASAIANQIQAHLAPIDIEHTNEDDLANWAIWLAESAERNGSGSNNWMGVDVFVVLEESANEEEEEAKASRFVLVEHSEEGLVEHSGNTWEEAVLAAFEGARDMAAIGFEEEVQDPELLADVLAVQAEALASEPKPGQGGVSFSFEILGVRIEMLGYALA